MSVKTGGVAVSDGFDPAPAAASIPAVAVHVAATVPSDAGAVGVLVDPAGAVPSEVGHDRAALDGGRVRRQAGPGARPAGRRRTARGARRHGPIGGRRRVTRRRRCLRTIGRAACSPCDGGAADRRDRRRPRRTGRHRGCSWPAIPTRSCRPRPTGRVSSPHADRRRRARRRHRARARAGGRVRHRARSRQLSARPPHREWPWPTSPSGSAARPGSAWRCSTSRRSGSSAAGVCSASTPAATTSRA